MYDKVRRALYALASEGIQSDAAFDQVAPALLEFGENDLAERLMDVAEDAPWEGIAAFLNIASWDVSPAAESQIFRTIEQWLVDATDLRRIHVALHMEIIPFSKMGADPKMLTLVLENVSAKFPETAARCSHVLGQAATLENWKVKDEGSTR